MKKVLIILFMLIILCSCDKEKKDNNIEFRFTDYYEYMIDNGNNIKRVTMTTITEGGRFCYNVTSFKDRLYDNIINTNIVSKTDIVVTDDDLIYTFEFNDGESINYKYNCTYLVINNENYEIDNYLSLPLNDIKDLEMECK